MSQSHHRHTSSSSSNMNMSASSTKNSVLVKTAVAFQKILSNTLSVSDILPTFIAQIKEESDSDTNGDDVFIEQASVYSQEDRNNDTISNSICDASVFGNPLMLEEIADLVSNGSSVNYEDLSSSHGQKKNWIIPLPIPFSKATKLLHQYGSNQENVLVLTQDWLNSNSNNNRSTKSSSRASSSESKAIQVIGRFQTDKQPLTTTLKIVGKIDGNVKLSREKLTSGIHEGVFQTTSYQVVADDKMGSVYIENKDEVFSLQVCLNMGLEHSPVHSVFCDLQKVRGLMKKLQKKDLLPDSGTDSSVTRVCELLESIKLGNEFADSTSETRGTLSSSLRSLSFEKRRDLDITEQLWNIVSVGSRLSECLKMVFSFLQAGECDMFVHKDNKTTLAQLVRQSNSGISCFPTVTDVLALRLVAEMGLDKLARECKLKLLRNDLCTIEQWDSFFASHESREEVGHTDDDLEEVIQRSLFSRFNALIKIHHCLEVVFILDCYLDNLNLARIVESMMAHYKSKPVDVGRLFTFPLTGAQAVPQVAGSSIYSLKREINLGQGRTKVENYFSELPPPLNLMVNSDASITPENQGYFLVEVMEHSMRL